MNPARSLGPALFAGSDALSHWRLFVLAPLLGAGLAAAVASMFDVPSVPARWNATLTDPTGARVPD